MIILNFWNGKKVFLTGHTGFKGSWISVWLQLMKAEVTGYSLDPPTDPCLFQLAKVDECITDIRGDIRDLDLLCSTLNKVKPEIVIHMAAQPIVRDSYRIPVDTYSTNVMGTVNLLEAVRGCKSIKAVINVTTDKCYENREWIWGYRENDSLGGYDPYSSSKACSELVTAAYRNSYFNELNYKEHGVAIASARAGNVIGGGDWAVDRLIPDCIEALLKGEKVLIRNPAAIRPWQHVLEPLYGYLILAQKLYENGPEYSGAWNFGPQEENLKSVGWIVERFFYKWGENKSYETDRNDNPHESNILKLDCSKAGIKLGWQPRWNIEKTLDSIIDWTKSFSRKENLKEVCISQIKDYLNSGLKNMKCRFCGKENIFKFLELGEMPLANNFLTEDNIKRGDEDKYPLDVFFCEQCCLVQIGYAVPPDTLFKNYIYFSNTSDLIHRHADYLVKSFRERLGLNENSFVVEVASNDGTVLHYFKRSGFKILGIEPAQNIAEAAIKAGIETINVFFNDITALKIKKEYGPADLILCRHVFAHVPEIHEFVKGLKDLLHRKGTVAIESPYLIDFVNKNEFDTIYHEHYSYLSVQSMTYLINLYDMEVFDLERVDIHGGSIIYFIGHKGEHNIKNTITDMLNMEKEMGLDKKETYISFSKRSEAVRKKIVTLLTELNSSNKRVVAYGAPAKGNTLLNYCGISTRLIEYTVDKSPYKQGLYTPGARIPVYHPDKIIQDMPDYVFLLAWNFAEEILDQQKTYREKGGKFIIPIPEVRIL